MPPTFAVDAVILAACPYVDVITTSVLHLLDVITTTNVLLGVGVGVGNACCC